MSIEAYQVEAAEKERARIRKAIEGLHAEAKQAYYSYGGSLEDVKAYEKVLALLEVTDD